MIYDEIIREVKTI